mmetsp:Transcript_10621/g.20083  ORF Transcript_10621/g.20083 Transcript_10621/m.20083 type:complete len:257 (+) Transcript_10621:1382-2152(+)
MLEQPVVQLAHQVFKHLLQRGQLPGKVQLRDGLGGVARRRVGELPTRHVLGSKVLGNLRALLVSWPPANAISHAFGGIRPLRLEGAFLFVGVPGLAGPSNRGAPAGHVEQFRAQRRGFERSEEDGVPLQQQHHRVGDVGGLHHLDHLPQAMEHAGVVVAVVRLLRGRRHMHLLQIRTVEMGANCLEQMLRLVPGFGRSVCKRVTKEMDRSAGAHVGSHHLAAEKRKHLHHQLFKIWVRRMCMNSRKSAKPPHRNLS